MKIKIQWYDEDDDVNPSDFRVIYNVLDAEATIEKMAHSFHERLGSEPDRLSNDNEVQLA